jgi:peptidyl-prolyl cis-trans isomerase D
LQKKANLPLPNKKLSAKEKNEYQRQQTLQLFNDEYEKLSDLTYTNSDSLAPAASALSLPIKTTGLFTKKGEVSGLAQNKKVLKIAFSDSVLKQGYNSNPVEISSGNVVVLRIKQHIPATTIPLEKVKTQIQNILLMEKAKAAAKEMSQQLLADLKQNKKPESLASRYNLPWKVLSKVKMANTNVNAEILKTAFDLPTPKDSEIGIKNVVLANGDCAVVVLYKTYIPNVTAKVDADKGQMQKLLQKDVADFTYAQFINGLMAKAKIKKEDLDKKSASDGGANVPLDDD